MEKRRGKRFRKRLTVKFGLVETEHVGFIEDISSTGIRMKSSTVFKPGSVINMDIVDEKHDIHMHVQGLVRWARKVPASMMQTHRCGMGLTYMKYDSNMQDYLIKMIEGEKERYEDYDDGSG